MKMLLPLLLALCAVAPPAGASHFAAQSGSRLTFTTSFEGEPFTGRFEKFDAAIRFDPDDLAGSRFDVRIPLASARTDNDERDEALHGDDFFDVAGFPVARYEATRFVKLKDGRYRAEGTLTLRGIKKAVPLVFSLSSGPNPILVGEATVNRLDFKVGGGEFGDVELIPNKVKVNTRLVLSTVVPVKRAEPAKK
jgi:polyisoprenoid-binding protein YceI